MTSIQYFEGVQEIQVTGSGKLRLSSDGELIGAVLAYKTTPTSLHVTVGNNSSETSSFVSGGSVIISNGDIVSDGSVIIGNGDIIGVRQSGSSLKVSNTISSGSISCGGISIRNNVITAMGMRIAMAPDRLELTVPANTVLVVNGITTKACAVAGQPVTTVTPAKKTFRLAAGTQLGSVRCHGQTSISLADASDFIRIASFAVTLSNSAKLTMPEDIGVAHLRVDASNSARFNGSNTRAGQVTLKASNSAEIESIHCADNGAITASNSSFVMVTARDPVKIVQNKTNSARIVVLSDTVRVVDPSGLVRDTSTTKSGKRKAGDAAVSDQPDDRRKVE